MEKAEGQIFFFPHSAFQLPHSFSSVFCFLSSLIYGDGESLRASRKASCIDGGGADVSGAGGGAAGGVSVSAGMACKPGTGLAA